jgi:hypothetical protein
LNQETLAQEGEIDTQNLIKLSKSAEFNQFDNIGDYSSQSEVEDHKQAFETILVS